VVDSWHRTTIIMPKRNASEDGDDSSRQRPSVKSRKTVDEVEAVKGVVCVKSEEILRGRLPFADGQVFFVESFVQRERGDKWLEGLANLETCAFGGSRPDSCKAFMTEGR
jgi:hypothetical protein